MRALSVHHLAVCTTDLAASERFYVDVLGLPVRRRWYREDGTPRAIWLELGEGAFLALEEVDGGPARVDESEGWHCVALRITPSERSRWVEQLGAAGHPLVRESDFTIYVRDPGGALVGLSHFPDDYPDER